MSQEIAVAAQHEVAFACRQFPTHVTTYRDQSSDLLKDTEVARILGVAPATLRSWRCRNTGPRYVKYGRSKGSAVRYHRNDLEAFIAQCRRLTSSVREA
jgi:hypothetical protein